MNSHQKTALITRDTLLKMLSDDEIASVSSAETSALLADGEEYLDLERLDQGVRRAKARTTPMERVLPKKAVHEKTWNKILAQLAKGQSAALPANP